MNYDIVVKYLRSKGEKGGNALQAPLLLRFSNRYVFPALPALTVDYQQVMQKLLTPEVTPEVAPEVAPRFKRKAFLWTF